MRSLLMITASLIGFASSASAGDYYLWVIPDSGQSDSIALYRNGVQIGAYSPSKGAYWPLLPGGEKWGKQTEPPFPPPSYAVGRRGRGEPNFGLESDKIQKGTSRLNGKAADKETIMGAIRSPPHDGSYRRLTIIGSAQDRAAVEKDVTDNPALAAALKTTLIQSYEPTAWEVTRVGFCCTGSPRIVYQDSTGKVLHSQPDYTGGADALVGAIRRANSGYDPALDPDLRFGGDSGLPDLFASLSAPFRDKWTLIAVLGLVLLAVLYYEKRKREQLP